MPATFIIPMSSLKVISQNIVYPRFQIISTYLKVSLIDHFPVLLPLKAFSLKISFILSIFEERSSPQESFHKHYDQLSSSNQPSAEVLAAERKAFTNKPSTVIFAESNLPTDLLILADHIGLGSYKTMVLYHPYPDVRNTQATDYGVDAEKRLEIYKILNTISHSGFISKKTLIKGILSKLGQIESLMNAQNLENKTEPKPLALIWGEDSDTLGDYLSTTYRFLPMNWYNKQPVALLTPMISKMIMGIYHHRMQHYAGQNDGPLYQTSVSVAQLPGLYLKEKGKHEIYQFKRNHQWLHSVDQVERWHHIHPRFHLMTDKNGESVRFRPTPRHPSDSDFKKAMGSRHRPISKDILSQAEQKCLKVSYVKQKACQGVRPSN